MVQDRGSNSKKGGDSVNAPSRSRSLAVDYVASEDFFVSRAPRQVLWRPTKFSWNRQTLPNFQNPTVRC
jgi:hypothetical protein